MMVKQQYTVSFVTPAFLGDAEQNGAWRTPPFKALLRQWWRVAAAKDHDYKYERLRETEGRLFGNAWLDNNFSQSQVKLRLDNWKNGQLINWPIPDQIINHPEVTNPAGHLQPVGSHLYLGYGPLTFRHRNTRLKANAAIQADDHSELTVIFPKTAEIEIATILQLIHWFGTVGGRSRNGWGSLLLEGDKLEKLEALKETHPLLNKLAKPLDQCLGCTWPHAIGKDASRLLIWTSKQPHNTWREAMVELAIVKIAFRTVLLFDPNRHHRIDKRHVLAYPVTHHNFNPWGNQSRLANQLRFKVTKNAEGQYIGLAYHLPCGIPGELLNALDLADRTWIVGQQLDVWRSVHGILDQQMQRI